MTASATSSSSSDDKLKDFCDTVDYLGSKIHRNIILYENSKIFTDRYPLFSSINKSSKQSALEKRFNLRDYQQHGVHWIMSLHENGLNGILADEPGLGKTLQVLSFLVALQYKHNIHGVHLMVGPLSVITSWVSEINKFAPDTFFVYVHYGERDEREKNLRNYCKYLRIYQKHYLQQHQQQQQQQKQEAGGRAAHSKGDRRKIALIITTYDLAIKDINLLKSIASLSTRSATNSSSSKGKGVNKKANLKNSSEELPYLIVDEAHRLKNRHCVLYGCLKQIPCQHRLLLTGTPLQNNLQELWNLLCFLLPHLFSEVEAAEAWQTWWSNDNNSSLVEHDPLVSPSDQSHQEESTSAMEVEGGEAGQGGTHQTDHQADTIVIPAEAGLATAADDSMMSSSSSLKKRVRGSAVRSSSLFAKLFCNTHNNQNKARNSFLNSNNHSNSSSSHSSTNFLHQLSNDHQQSMLSALHRVIKPFILRRLKKDVVLEVPKKIMKILYCPLTPLQMILHEIIRKLVNARIHLHQRTNNNKKEMNSMNGSSEEGGHSSAEVKRLKQMVEEDALSYLKLERVYVMLRQCCNHPFLSMLYDNYYSYLHRQHQPAFPDELYFEKLIESSGKFLVLDRLLLHLIPQGSKVLIFSQMTTTLDVIDEYLRVVRGWSCYRIDGNTDQVTRQASILKFNGLSTGGEEDNDCEDNKDEEPKIFLLSTRSGGVGINLQAADVVILFDHDWNPQQDLQAISRAHRIGQQKTVLVFRLISTSSSSSSSASASTSGGDHLGGFYTLDEHIFLRAQKRLLANKQILVDANHNGHQHLHRQNINSSLISKTNKHHTQSIQTAGDNSNEERVEVGEAEKESLYFDEDEPLEGDDDAYDEDEDSVDEKGRRKKTTAKSQAKKGGVSGDSSEERCPLQWSALFSSKMTKTTPSKQSSLHSINNKNSTKITATDDTYASAPLPSPTSQTFTPSIRQPPINLCHHQSTSSYIVDEVGTIEMICSRDESVGDTGEASSSNGEGDLRDDDCHYEKIALHLSDSFIHNAQQELQTTWKAWIRYFEESLVPSSSSPSTLTMQSTLHKNYTGDDGQDDQLLDVEDEGVSADVGMTGRRITRNQSSSKNKRSTVITADEDEEGEDDIESEYEEEDRDGNGDHDGNERLAKRKAKRELDRYKRNELNGGSTKSNGSSSVPANPSSQYRSKRKLSPKKRKVNQQNEMSMMLMDVDGTECSGSTEGGRTTQDEPGEDDDDDPDDICILCGQSCLTEEEFRMYHQYYCNSKQNNEGKINSSNNSKLSLQDYLTTMILCDGCDGAYHMICVGLEKVPDNEWYCCWCVTKATSIEPEDNVIIEVLTEGVECA